MFHVNSIYCAEVFIKLSRKFPVFGCSSNFSNIPQNLCGLIIGKVAMETGAKNYPLWRIQIEIVILKQYLMCLLLSERDFPVRGCSHITGISVISFVAFIYKEDRKNIAGLIGEIIRLLCG